MSEWQVERIKQLERDKAQLTYRLETMTDCANDVEMVRELAEKMTCGVIGYEQ